MTAAELARAECANHAEGICRGIAIDAKNVTTCTPLAFCLLSKRLPCLYFERCVLPLAVKQDRWRGADSDYRDRTRLGTPQRPRLDVPVHPFCRKGPVLEALVDAPVRRCDCGNPLEKGKRLCSECKREHQRLAGRTSRGNLTRPPTMPVAATKATENPPLA